MINYDSILSAFDGKPTLLQWLKMIKKALDESVLKDITLKQDGASVVFTFNLEEGTSISTPAVTLPKGNTGAKGDKGDKGDQGVSVTGVDEVSNEVVGSQTHTTLRFNFSNGTNNEVVVHAENGKNASGGKLYVHNIEIRRTSGYSIPVFTCQILNSRATQFQLTDFQDHENVGCIVNAKMYGANETTVPPSTYIAWNQIDIVIANNIPTKVAITFEQTYPFRDGEYTMIEFDLTDGNTSYSDTVTEL